MTKAVTLRKKVQQPTNLEEIGALYVRLMEEIKRRVAVVQQILNGSWTIPAMAAYEFCYIELRKICEVFALACLTAHGDIPEVRTKIIQKTYNADQIIKQLSRLNPQFYPTPGQQRLHPVTQQPLQVVDITSEFLTKQELLELYAECGNYLHRGSIRQLLTKWEPDINFERIRDWIGKIVRLLNHHQIQTSQPDTQLWVLMQEKTTGDARFHIMKKLPPDDPRIPASLIAGEAR